MSFSICISLCVSIKLTRLMSLALLQDHMGTSGLPLPTLYFTPEEYSCHLNYMPENLPQLPAFLRWVCRSSPFGILIFLYLLHSVGYMLVD